jgi:hypothetical protein
MNGLDCISARRAGRNVDYLGGILRFLGFLASPAFLFVLVLYIASKVVSDLCFGWIFSLNRITSNYFYHLSDNFLPLSKIICRHRIKSFVCSAIR